jgi:hypothetical protein
MEIKEFSIVNLPEGLLESEIRLLIERGGLQEVTLDIESNEKESECEEAFDSEDDVASVISSDSQAGIAFATQSDYIGL